MTPWSSGIESGMEITVPRREGATLLAAARASGSRQRMRLKKSKSLPVAELRKVGDGEVSRPQMLGTERELRREFAVVIVAGELVLVVESENLLLGNWTILGLRDSVSGSLPLTKSKKLRSTADGRWVGEGEVRTPPKQGSSSDVLRLRASVSRGAGLCFLFDFGGVVKPGYEETGVGISLLSISTLKIFGCSVMTGRSGIS